jgi:DNA repair exonuclease SbcCD nuclease subunit
MTRKKLNKAACFTDIHWGRKNNSELHNQDCLNFIRWFCEQAVSNDADHIIFLGDWFEHRAAINGMTLDYAYTGAQALSDTGLPVYFLVGNHDLYYRTTRDVYSTRFFDSLGFNVIREPIVHEECGPKGSLFSPYLFEKEYPELLAYGDIPIWWGHFEFKGFVVTGDTRKMEHGPDPSDFLKPKRIFSGHFHKRQTSRNITYIGNVFPADFSDANDTERGMMLYTYEPEEIEYIDWPDCPTYIKTSLSVMAKKPDKVLRKDATVNCVVDLDIDYKQSLKLREKLVKKYGLRELTLQESPELKDALENTEILEELDQLDTVDARVKLMLGKVETTNIKKDKLISIYEEL